MFRVIVYFTVIIVYITSYCVCYGLLCMLRVIVYITVITLIECYGYHCVIGYHVCYGYCVCYGYHCVCYGYHRVCYGYHRVCYELFSWEESFTKVLPFTVTLEILMKNYAKISSLVV